MKKKMVSVLLALVMFAGLALPVYAEPQEDLPFELPQEEMDTVVFWWGTSEPVWEEVATEDGVVRIVQCMGPDLMSVGTFSALSAQQASLENCPICGENNWYGKPQDGPYACVNDGNPSTHEAHYLVPLTCQTPGCISTKWDEMTRRESHSLSKTGFGRNYHKGTLHYVEWNCVCDDCGYQTTKLESQPCPGNNNGEGCIFGINKVEPPVEVQDVTEPEESILPEGTE